MDSNDHPAYWLAQLRKADWQYLLKFVDVKLPAENKETSTGGSCAAAF